MRDFVDSVKVIHFVRDYEDSVIYYIRDCVDSVKDTLCPCLCRFSERYTLSVTRKIQLKIHFVRDYP